MTTPLPFQESGLFFKFKKNKFGNTDIRLYVCRMEVQNKRRARAYKVYDKVYSKALKRGHREKKPLAQLLEKVVGWYAEGHTIGVFQGETNKAFKID